MNDYYLYCCKQQDAADTSGRMTAALAAGQSARDLEPGTEEPGWWRTVFAEDDAAAVAVSHELLGDGAEVKAIGPGVLLGII